MMTLSNFKKFLLLLTLLLPVAQLVLSLYGRLLGSMGDRGTPPVIAQLSEVTIGLWIVVLVLLLIAVGWDSVQKDQQS